jgi:chromosome segregation protein
MEDVIFQGSARRRPLSMGEVTLTLGTDNGDANHPMADDGKITIHRRVFRDGQSEFRLNGKRVRMKDISDILMDTGLGIRNYSVMEQGKIDLILSNKPQDCRKLIEEAAGITKYKTKRRAAELKLEETQQNLLRIDDTLSEVTRNLNSLKRQASKARRQRAADQLSLAKRALYKGRILAAQIEEEAANAGLADAQNRESELAAQLGTDEAELAETRTVHTDRSHRASKVREEIAGLSGEVERLRSFLQQSETNLGDLLQRIENGRTQIATFEAEATEQQAALDEKTQQFESARAERNRFREIADQVERDRQERRHGPQREVPADRASRSCAPSPRSPRRAIRYTRSRSRPSAVLPDQLTESARKAAESRDGALSQMYEGSIRPRRGAEPHRHAAEPPRRDRATATSSPRNAKHASPAPHAIAFADDVQADLLPRRLPKRKTKTSAAR